MAFFFINSVSNSRLNDDFYEGVRLETSVDLKNKIDFRDVLDLVEQKYGSLLVFFALSDLLSVSFADFTCISL